MWDIGPRRILVAVDSAVPEAALRYAAAEAVRRGCGLHLVHVARQAGWATSPLDDVSLMQGELREFGVSMLGAAAIRAEHLVADLAPGDPRLSVSTELTHGSVVSTLRSLNSHAALVVLQRQGARPRELAPSLSVTAAVAAAAACPVVVVPSAWRPPAGARGTVVVGVEDGRDVAVLGAAQAVADGRGVPLRALTVAGTRPADVLLADPDALDLVVVGRHHPRHILGPSLGRTAFDVVRRSPVPVMLVDPGPRPFATSRPKVPA